MQKTRWRRRQTASLLLLLPVFCYLHAGADAFVLDPLALVEPGPLFSLRHLESLIAAAEAPDGGGGAGGWTRGINGGIPCATCTVVLGIAGQLSQIYNETVPATAERICGYLPAKYEGGCRLVARYVAPIIIKEFGRHASADTVCYDIGICYVDPGKKMCHLFPLPRSMNEVDGGEARWTDGETPTPKVVSLNTAYS